MDKPSCILKFHSYTVKEMDFKLSPAYYNDEYDEKLSIGIGHEVEIDSDNRQAIVCLTCNIGDENSGSPFVLNVAVEGEFSYHSNNDEDPSFERISEINATAILYPYLRSIVTDITKAANISPVILPVANIHKLLSKKDNKEEKSL